MARVALDADVVIAFLDPGDDQHAQAVTELRRRLAAGDELVIGATVYAETIVRPLQSGTDATVDEFLDSAGIRVVPIDREIARRAAALRAAHPSLRLPDAMSLAAAIATDSTLLTLDKKLRRIVRVHQVSGLIAEREAQPRIPRIGGLRPSRPRCRSRERSRCPACGTSEEHGATVPAQIALLKCERLADPQSSSP
ncbi:MAG TPA: PIN domain-containing protein [Solirubrobacteraceae bacterium]|nr:PIN domain-containing protein [Solirubrobacteraceae bacterium]